MSQKWPQYVHGKEQFPKLLLLWGVVDLQGVLAKHKVFSQEDIECVTLEDIAEWGLPRKFVRLWEWVMEDAIKRDLPHPSEGRLEYMRTHGATKSFQEKLDDMRATKNARTEAATLHALLERLRLGAPAAGAVPMLK
jgi:hypothetical protein